MTNKTDIKSFTKYVDGYKYEGYKANYTKRKFIISIKEDDVSCLVEVQDWESGEAFILPMKKGEIQFDEQFIKNQRKKAAAHNRRSTGKQKSTEGSSSELATDIRTSRN